MAAINSAVISTVGSVARGATATFDVKGAIDRDGVCCLALDTTSTDGADYSRGGSLQRPAMVVQVAR